MSKGLLDNFYARLGIPKNASSAQIREAYHLAAKRLHPDTNQSPAATELFLQVQEAYDTLCDPIKRAAYDATIPSEIEGPYEISANAIYSRSSLTISDSPQLIYLLLDLMPLLTQEQQTSQDITRNICLVLDNSTSMENDRINSVKSTAALVLKYVSAKDYFSVVSFNDRPDVVVPAHNQINPQLLKSKISLIATGGGTEIFKGLEAGMQEISKHLDQSQINQLLLITDGNTYGDEERCFDLAKEASLKGFSITCVGIGREWNEDFLDQLSSLTGSTSYFAPSSSEIKSIIENKFNQIQDTYAENITFEYHLEDEVQLRYAFRLAPDTADLPLKEIVPLGRLPKGKHLSVLFEFYVSRVPENKNHLVLAEGILKLTIPGDSIPHKQYRVSFSRPCDHHTESAPPPPVIIKAMSKLSLYRLQEKAYEDIKNGEFELATRRLSQVKFQLLTAGSPDLAALVDQEIAELTQSKSPTENSKKDLKYGTRALVFPDQEQE